MARRPRFIVPGVVSLLICAASAFVFVDHDETLFVHSVYFWMNEDATEMQRDSFIDILRELEQIESVQALEVGVPADTPREVVDNSYDVALFVYFEDRIGHDKYQSDTIHTDAITRFEGWVDSVRIYDALTIE